MVGLLPLWLATSAATAYSFRLPFMAQKPLEAPTTTATTSGSDPRLQGCYSVPSPPPPVPAEWKCDILAWVRSPDLVPNTIVPADVRISANGTGCKDIVEWSVGLSFKERVLTKLRSPNAPPEPKRPEREEFNNTATARPHSEIYGFRSWSFGGRGSAYGEAMEAYEDELSNPSRWKLEGIEHPVFHTNLTLDIPPESWLDDKWLDATSAFSVVMPNTNFPPTLGFTHRSRSIGQPLMWLESLLEYHVSARHRDGSWAYIPAGYTAFTPLQSPVSPWPAPLPESQWPKQLELASPRPNPKDVKPGIGAASMTTTGFVSPRRPDVPACDEGNFAQFNISVAKANAEETIVQGRNTTLNVTIARTGNGSEYLLFLNFRYLIVHAYPWLLEITNDEDYRYLSGPALGSSNNLTYTLIDTKLLKAPNETFFPARRPVYGGTYYFGKPEDVYEFQINLTIRHDAIPTFVTSFETLRSALSLSLHTYFECEPKAGTQRDRERMMRPPSTTPTVQSEAEKAARARDVEWKEAWPERNRRKHPVISKTDKKGMNGRVRRQQHSGIVSLDVASPLDSQPETLHYAQNGARGPVLLPGRATERDRPATHPLLCLGVRKEKDYEMETDRYQRRLSEKGRAGGEASYAARMWLEAEIAKRGQPKDEEDEYD